MSLRQAFSLPYQLKNIGFYLYFVTLVGKDIEDVNSRVKLWLIGKENIELRFSL